MTPLHATALATSESAVDVEELIELYAAAARRYLVDRMVLWAVAA